MARAHTVWVVVSDTDRAPMAVFTVKHELRTWLSRKTDSQKSYWSIWSIPDGSPDYRFDDRRPRFLARADNLEWEKL